MKRLTVLAAIFASVFATSTSAATMTLNCTMTDMHKSGGWIPKISIIEVDTTQKTIELLKPTAEEMGGKVKSSKLVRNTQDKMILRWILTGTKSKSNQRTPAFNYRALLHKNTGKVSVIAKPLGYGNDFRAKGDCKIS
ncbi:hypothetical protein [uncultured Litoreibacter sp.]|uniref:hypothetical protein n=1 Tax=uncultured Litoreibacter sp. TaxID=1392394 RepID=UPI002601FB32|nr:hypothetical protein [uncultured Litoreibacter sp.]